MWKAQLLTDSLYVIKLGPPEYIIGRLSDSAHLIQAYYVLYDFKSSQILGIYNNTNLEWLAHIYYDSDWFLVRYFPNYHRNAHASNSSSDNILHSNEKRLALTRSSIEIASSPREPLQNGNLLDDGYQRNNIHSLEKHRHYIFNDQEMLNHIFAEENFRSSFIPNVSNNLVDQEEFLASFLSVAVSKHGG